VSAEYRAKRAKKRGARNLEGKGTKKSGGEQTAANLYQPSIKKGLRGRDKREDTLNQG